MSSLPFNAQQCFFVAMIVFAIIGFQRGWRREMISLAFVLLAVFLGGAGASGVGAFLARIPNTIGFMITGDPASGNPITAPIASFLGPWGPLAIFAGIVAIGYLIGNKAFPKPATPADRVLGIIPAIIEGAFVLVYLNGIFTPTFTVNLQSPNPGNFVPTILLIAIGAVVVALIAARTKKATKK